MFQKRVQIVNAPALAELWPVVRAFAEDRRLVVVAKNFAGYWTDKQSIDVKEGCCGKSWAVECHCSFSFVSSFA
ncbi:hypothetical protein D3C76_1326490 [compost metagenome]